MRPEAAIRNVNLRLVSARQVDPRQAYIRLRLDLVACTDAAWIPHFAFGGSRRSRDGGDIFQLARAVRRVPGHECRTGDRAVTPSLSVHVAARTCPVIAREIYVPVPDLLIGVSRVPIVIRTPAT